VIVYFNGRFLDKSEVRIDPEDRGFMLADGTYEFVRIYNGRPFRLREHLRRFANSLSQIRMALPADADFEAVAGELIRRNGMDRAESALYLQITRGAAPRRHPFPDPAVPPTIYAALVPVTPPEDKWRDGVAAITVPDLRWGRCDIKSIGLLPNVLAAQRAAEAGAEEAIFTAGGAITEGTHTNVAAVFGGAVHTHPTGTAILDGITREVVRECCATEGIAFVERPVPEADFRSADEIFIMGSSTELMAVIRLDGRPVGDGKPGPVLRRLQAAFHRRTRGEN
jgi:D-alanine transaminase